MTTYIKTFTNHTPAQIQDLFSHAQKISAALSDANDTIFPKPQACDKTSISYDFLLLPSCILPLLQKGGLSPRILDLAGRALARIHGQTNGKDALLHADYVPHNLFSDNRSIYIIDPHPPEYLGYRADLLYGDPAREFYGFIFSLLSDVGLKHALAHQRTYLTYIRDFMFGYDSLRPRPPLSLLSFYTYARDVYAIKRRAGFSRWASSAHCASAFILSLYAIWRAS